MLSGQVYREEPKEDAAFSWHSGARTASQVSACGMASLFSPPISDLHPVPAACLFSVFFVAFSMLKTSKFTEPQSVSI